MNKHPKAETGIWVLMSPSGIIYTGENPLKCVQKEMQSRIPAEVMLKRLLDICDIEHNLDNKDDTNSYL